MRCLLLILLLPLFAVPVYSQATNPTVDRTCKLPKEGIIVESVTYTLEADCTQTGPLHIQTSETPNVTLTINGGGHTIFGTSGHDGQGIYFIVVGDQGAYTYYNLDNSPSPNVKVIIKNVTFDGKNLKFRRHHRWNSHDDMGESFGYGSAILTDGPLTMENVTFTRGNGVWVRVKGTATLTNVLFEDSWIRNFGSTPITYGGALYVTSTGSVTLNNAVFRDIGRAVIAIEEGGSLSTTGCLRFIRVWTHKLHHSGLFSGFGTWSDSSTVCSDDKDIGNGDQAVVAYSPPMLDCGLPSSGIIGGTVVYTLISDCVCMNTVVIAADARVTINGNGHRIVGCESPQSTLNIGNGRLIINRARLYNIRIYNFGGYFTFGNSMLAEAKKTPIQNRGWAYLYESSFVDNKGVGNTEGNVYDGYGGAGLGMVGHVILRDNIFRGNTLGETEIYTKGRGSIIFLCGENVRDGAAPQNTNGVEPPLFIAENGARLDFACPLPGPPAPAPGAVCQPEQVEPPARREMGAIGVIFYVEKCPTVIEIWEVMPDSQGKFALEVSQNEIEAVAEGLVACSSNGRAAVRVGLTEPVRQKIAHSQAYQAVSPRKARDILISLGPNAEGKALHLVIDNALTGRVLGFVDTSTGDSPCQGADLTSLFAAASPPAQPQPTPIPYASPVTPQPAEEDGSIVHVVQSGDTIWQIGIAYDVHPYRIISQNNLNKLSSQGAFIFPGQRLLIRQAQ